MSFCPPLVYVRLAMVWLAVAIASSGCVGNHTIVPAPGADPASPVAWYGPEGRTDHTALGRWRRSVGPPLLAATGPRDAAPADRLIVVSWNVNVGAGDVPQLFMEIAAQAGPGVPIVFLLQEAYRSGAAVPAGLDRRATFPSPIRGVRPDGGRDEIQALASGLGLHAYYVPSMRNGGPLSSDEDRGNAILSSVPLAGLSAIELPFERQRRVAIGATVNGLTSRGERWQVRVVSAHLDNMAGARRLWVAGSEFARTRQARGLVEALESDAPVILGADLNTLFGFADSAYVETARAFPQTNVTDRRTTFRGLLRLDHLFFRLEEGWTASFHRAEHPYGSDHYPLIGTVRFH